MCREGPGKSGRQSFALVTLFCLFPSLHVWKAWSVWAQDPCSRPAALPSHSLCALYGMFEIVLSHQVVMWCLFSISRCALSGSTIPGLYCVHNELGSLEWFMLYVEMALCLQYYYATGSLLPFSLFINVFYCTDTIQSLNIERALLLILQDLSCVILCIVIVNWLLYWTW